MATLRRILEGPGDPHVIFMTGGRGVGRSRLAAEGAAVATQAGHTIAQARAFPLRTGGSYSLLSDCFTPILRELDETSLQVLTRGAVDALAQLFPAAVSSDGAPGHGGPGRDGGTRAFWSFTELLRNLAERNPTLVVLDDLHWSDEPSLQLLHFAARHTRGLPLRFLCTYADSERSTNEALMMVESSLLDLGVAIRQSVSPLSQGDTVQLLERGFGVDSATVSDFAHVLYQWTQGSPWLIDAILRDLRERQVLVRERGSWRGWSVDAIELPESVADATVARFDRLSDAAKATSEVIAIMGGWARLEDLEALEEVDGTQLLSALDELRDRRLIQESEVDGEISFDFTHPVFREVLRSRLGLARRRDLHGRCGRVLEQRQGFGGGSTAETLAFHYAEADPLTLGTKERRYLAEAGRNALARRENARAEKYLLAALRRGQPLAPGGALPFAELLLILGRAQHRLGKTTQALATFHEALGQVPVDTEGTAVTAAIRRRIGLLHLAESRHRMALEQFDAGLQVATSDAALRERANLLISQGACFHEVGRRDDAAQAISEANDIAERLGDNALRARVARSLVIFHAWSGPAHLAREHGERALTLARTAGDAHTAFWAYWGLAVSAAMSGKAQAVDQYIRHGAAISDQLGAPLLKAWLTELIAELHYATGEWNQGIEAVERALAVSRAISNTALTVRLLVLASMFYLERGDFGRGRRYVDEAWTLSESTPTGPEAPADFFMMIPAHVGKAACALWEGDYDEAVAIGEAGIALAEGSGYEAWTIHRLLPIVAESHLMLRNLDQAERVGERLRALSERLDHALGKAWASACDAIVMWLRGDPIRGAVQLREATEFLESVPMVPYAARVRRQLAGRLAETGDRAAALVELRKVYDIFSRLGAEGELAKTREMFREVEARPPRRTAGAGAAGLTARELQIARLVGERMSNKAIGRLLGVSHRTVSTHLSNIFKKLDIGSRSELGDLVRDKRL